ncbi:peptidase M4 family protein [Micromonospora globispora]|uniref:Neutral metalloproteinase n=2 Tax=Micromonospora globispora TaxID=1450148 RepID=A0A317JYH8_9ACTN|nr:M4 family metallopeptidase [Micromonospora globispora]PWU45635.1 peptidase M4 family protein [Micromonospora globispora]RQW96822.1 peptidase M4 family protein [Micromonospora globispora]
MRRTTLLGGLATAALLAAAGTLPATASAAPATSADAFTRAVAQLKAHAGSALVADGQSFTLQNVLTDADGTEHVRVHRYQDGLPVLGGDTVVHLGKGNTWRGASQTLTAAPTRGAKATISAAAAGRIALAASTATGTKVDGSQLVYDAGRSGTALAYQVVVSGVRADGTPSQLNVLVDATTGAVRDAWDAIQADGTGNTFHSGSVPVGTTLSGGTYQLNDGARGGHKTYDLNGGTSGTGTLVTNASNVFGDGTLANRQTTAADAAYGAAETWDYYKNTFGRNGIRNDGVAAYSRVHYSTNYVNAFWSDSCFCMTYGDGDPSQGWTPLTSLDVAGHEMSHGVTSNTAGLRYSGESGGLNEATSDIFGTMVEFYAANSNDPGDYLIGEELRTNGVPLRYMDKPSKDGSSADCWSRRVGSLDVHYSSGVANHFFYLLAVGSGASSYGNSPTCNGSTVTGIGNAKAGAIWYRALTVYMTSRTDYAGARAASLSAAADLYGSGSTEYNTVAAAWSAVSVN